MHRKEAMIATGMLLGLLIFTGAALGVGPEVFAPNAQAATGDLTVAETPLVEPVLVTSTPAAEAMQSPEIQRVLEQNRQLRDAVKIMQDREADYRAQLELANQTILTLEESAAGIVVDAPVDTATWTAEPVGEEYEVGEHHEGEHEQGEHEDGEHGD